MDLTQQSVLSFLVEEGGKVKKSDLVRRFKGSTDCEDPEDRARNRDTFKNFVNNVAVVKEIDGARFVVLRKKYEPLVESYRAQERNGGESEDVDAVRKGELQQSQEEGNDEEAQESSTGIINPIEMALQRCKYDFKLKRGMDFSIQNEAETQANKQQSKPYALPLRMPPTKIEFRPLKSEDAHAIPASEASQDTKRAKPEDTSAKPGSPVLRRSAKSSTKASADLKENRAPSTVPLEQSEHEWLVKCASGHWSQVYGLLLRDSQLAEKRDFMSGFTALHWAAKCGNSDMLVKILELSKAGGVEVDVDAKTHGGYTPLHIAALHDQEYILAMLVGEYGANPRIRDNCGRRAYHYLHKGVSKTIREMLGEPQMSKEVKEVPHEKEEQDVFTDFSKSLHSISKLFQPTLIGYKRKPKQRPSLYSLQDATEAEEREEEGGAGPRHRLLSDVFM